jgi:hypothetical protein
MMPYVGAPFLPEGSPEGLLETIQLIRSLEPRLLVHGHTPLTEQFTIEALPGLEAALRDVHALVLRDIREGKAPVDTLERNHLPEVLRSHPSAVVPFVVMRDHFVKRLYHQRTGYWKWNGDGMEDVSASQWAAALDLLGGRKEQAFVGTAEILLGQGDSSLAFRLVDLGLAKYPASRRLSQLRRRALDRLREQHQQLNPFKFIIFSEWAEAELQPVE